jgi:hypothetical protein
MKNPVLIVALCSVFLLPAESRAQTAASSTGGEIQPALAHALPNNQLRLTDQHIPQELSVSSETAVEIGHDVVRHDAGRPPKPHLPRPGDINRQDNPPMRYRLPDCTRAGSPHATAWWANCAIDRHYSAWFVGGGTPRLLSSKSRPREGGQGTWGLDYDGLFPACRVWLRWSEGRPQGGLGAYDTDH